MLKTTVKAIRFQLNVFPKSGLAMHWAVWTIELALKDDFDVTVKALMGSLASHTWVLVVIQKE